MTVSRTAKAGKQTAAQIALSAEPPPSQEPAGTVGCDKAQGKKVRSNVDRFRFMEAVLADRELKPVQRVIGVRLALFLNCTTGQLNPSYLTLGEATGITDRYAIEHVKALVAAGWVSMRRSAGRTSNEYQLWLPNHEDTVHG